MDAGPRSVAASAARAGCCASGRCRARSRPTSGCCSATCPSTCSGWGRPPWPARWWSGSTRPAGARPWPATSGAPTAGCWSPTPTGRPCSTASTPACRRPGAPGRRCRVRRRRVAAHAGADAGRGGGRLRARPRATSTSCCSPRGPPAPPRRCGAPRAGWPSIAVRSAEAYGFDRDDVAYCTMPLFHGNALMVLWGPSLVVGATVALARRFSASGFLPDVRRYGATTFTYVGKALAYVLATPPSADDASMHPAAGLRHRGVGGRPRRLRAPVRLRAHRGVRLERGRGGHQPGARTRRSAPSAGRSEDVAVVDPETHRRECPPAEFDAAGAVAQRRRGHRRDRQPVRASDGSRGTTTTRRPPPSGPGTAGTGPGDLAYRDADGLLLLRRSAGRLDAGRLGEPDRRPHRAGAGPLPRRGHRGRLLGARPAVGRPGDGRLRDAPGPPLRPRRLRRLPGRPSPTSAPSGSRPSCGSPPALPQTASGKVTKDPLRAEGWWRGTTRSTGAGGRRRPTCSWTRTTAGAAGRVRPPRPGGPRRWLTTMGCRRPMGRRPPLAHRPPLARRPPLAHRPPLARRPPLAHRPPLGRRPPLAHRPPLGRRPRLGCGAGWPGRPRGWPPASTASSSGTG